MLLRDAWAAVLWMAVGCQAATPLNTTEGRVSAVEAVGALEARVAALEVLLLEGFSRGGGDASPGERHGAVSIGESRKDNVSCRCMDMMTKRMSSGSLMNGTCMCMMGMDGMSMKMNMDMTFYSSKDVKILFEGWGGEGTTLWQYWLSLAAIFVAAIFHEYTILLRQRVRHRRRISSRQVSSLLDSKSASGEKRLWEALPNSSGESTPLTSTNQWKQYFLAGSETLIYLVNVAMAYLLMTIAMTLNAGCFLAVCFGLTTGFLFFKIGTVSVRSAKVNNVNGIAEEEAFDVCHGNM